MTTTRLFSSSNGCDEEKKEPDEHQQQKKNLIMQFDCSSLEILQDRVEAFLKKHSHDIAGPPQLAIAIAGGGGHFLSTLASTPGASQLLLEGTLLYDRESYHRYVQPIVDAGICRNTDIEDVMSSNKSDHDDSNNDSQQQQHQPVQTIMVNGGSSASSTDFQRQDSAESNDSHRSSFSSSSGSSTGTRRHFRYASAESAWLASQAAMRRALLFKASSSSNDDHHHPNQPSVLNYLQQATGVAVASALQSKVRRSSSSHTAAAAAPSSAVPRRSVAKGSRAFVAVARHAFCSSNSNGPLAVVQLQAHLAVAEENDINNNRTRFDEDVFVSHCILTCLEYALQYEQQQQQSTSAVEQQQQHFSVSSDHVNGHGGDASKTTLDNESSKILHQEITPYGDHITIYVDDTTTTNEQQETFDSNNNDDDSNNHHNGKEEIATTKTAANGNTTIHTTAVETDTDTDLFAPSKQVIWDAASRILKANETLARTGHYSGPPEDSVVLLIPTWGIPTTSITPQFMTLSHSFLPPKSLIFPGSFHPPHTGHIQLANAALKATSTNNNDNDEDGIAWFELALTNADKPPLEPNQVVERCIVFLELLQQQQTLRLQDDDDDEQPPEYGTIMPKQWGVILTNAPLFKQKVDLLHPLQALRSAPPLPFVIGTDTLVRLMDPKYYNHSEEQMLDALTSMPCHFVVGGRLEQSKDKTAVKKYVSGHEDLQKLPSRLHSKFTILPDFRVDISSSEIRAAAAAAKQEEEEAAATASAEKEWIPTTSSNKNNISKATSRRSETTSTASSSSSSSKE